MSNLRKTLYCMPVLLWFLVALLIGFSEYYRVGIAAYPSVIDTYNFGSEAMISHGGEKYRSAAAYSEANMLLGLFSALGMSLTLATLYVFKSHAVLKAYAIAVTLIAVSYAI
jgi:hypothetical protein